MKAVQSAILPKEGAGILAAGCVLVTCGAALLIYAWVARLSAARFLEKGIEGEARIQSIEGRGTRQGGRRIEVSFWDRREGGPPIGGLRRAGLTDLLPLRHSGEREGDEIAIRWYEDGERLRIAPEASLNAETRPPEMRFDFGLGIAATGGILLGWHTLREARRKERPGEQR